MYIHVQYVQYAQCRSDYQNDYFHRFNKVKNSSQAKLKFLKTTFVKKIS